MTDLPLSSTAWWVTTSDELLKPLAEAKKAETTPSTSSAKRAPISGSRSAILGLSFPWLLGVRYYSGTV
jgi:hypothetical protein